MTAAINPELVISEGDVFTQRFPILDFGGDPVPLTNPSAFWGLFPLEHLIDGDQPILSKDSVTGGIRVVQEGTTWVVYVDFIVVDTEDNINIPMGKHYWELRIVDETDEEPGQTVATGILTILPTGVRP